MAKVDGASFSRDFDSYFEDVDRKFVVCPSGELNVAGITTLAQVDHSLEECVWRFLREHQEINSVIVRSYDAPDGRATRVFSNDHALITILDKLLAIAPEENFYAHPVRHLWRDSDNRRALRPAELEPLFRPRLLDVRLIEPAHDDSWIPRNDK
jgi:hypothetical protein